MRDSKIIIFSLFMLIFFIQSVSAISNVQHSVDGNKVTLTYQGIPPFWINIREDTDIGQMGGYLWAKTYSNLFSYDMSFAINPSKKFYYGVKDIGWSRAQSFSVGELPCSEEVIIFKEKEQYEFIVPPNKCYNGTICNGESEFSWFYNDNFIKKFYETHEDKYDFLVVFPQERLRTFYSYTVNFDLKGIGRDDSFIKNQYTTKLLDIAVMTYYDTYNLIVKTGNQPTLDQNLLKGVIFHEIAHQWCCYAAGIYGTLPAHWTSNLDLFDGEITKIDPMGYAHWVLKDGKEYCVSQDNWKFSKLTLYLMGLVSPKNIPPIKVHEFEKKSGDDRYNTWGPLCGEEHKFTNTSTVTIDKIIQINGKRIPDYSSSKKNFITGYVVVVPYNSEIDDSFVNYVSMYMGVTSKEWSDATSNTSIMTVCG